MPRGEDVDIVSLLLERDGGIHNEPLGAAWSHIATSR